MAINRACVDEDGDLYILTTHNSVVCMYRGGIVDVAYSVEFFNEKLVSSREVDVEVIENLITALMEVLPECT